MRRAALWLGVLGLVATALPSGIALAQARVDASSVPDVPSGAGVIRGRLLHDDPQAAAGQTVLLYSLSPSGAPGLRTGRSDGQGEFRFADISNDPGMVYVVGARSGEVPFGTRVVFEAGESEARVDVRLASPSADTSPLVGSASRIRIDRGCTQLRVTESHPLGNPTDRPIYIPEDARAESEPLFRSQLPEAAIGFEPAIGSLEPGLVREGRTVTYWGPVRSGGSLIEFSYALPSEPESQTLHWRFETGVERVTVATHRDGIRVAGPDLRPGPSETIRGRPYRSVEASDLEPGSELAVSLEIPAAAAAAAGGFSVPEVEIWLDLDDASLGVDEQYEFEVPGHTPLQAATDAPLLCLSLPADAEDLRFSPRALEMGLVADPSGELAVYGPIPGGKSSLSLRYSLVSGEPPVVFERRFPRNIALLSMFVADTHLLAESDRLHRLRPVRGQTRNYLHLEGFGIEPEQPVSLQLTPLPPHRGVSKFALAGLAVAAALGAAGFLVSPLRGRGDGPALLQTAVSSITEERESVYQAIRDLDEDLEDGKLSEADHAALRSELRAQAIALLEAERRATQTPAAPAGPEAFDGCPRCREAVSPGAAYCSQCGARLGGARAESAD
jgi:hypothetical protein